MPAAPFTHYVFVDLENVPGVDVSAAAGHPVHVTLLIGKQQKSFGLEMLRAAQVLGERLELVEVGASGRNALDLTLAYYLGRTAASVADADFAIVSKDKDFDPMVAHLQAKGVRVSRHPSFATLPFLPAAKSAARRVPAPIKAVAVKVTAASKKLGDDLWDKIVGHLGNPHHPRPGTRKRLLGFLKDRLGKDRTDAEAQSLLDRLAARGHLSISPTNKVTYP